MTDEENYEPQHAAEEPSQTVILKGSTYDFLKNFALVVLPALGALYFGLAQIWGLPNPEEVVGTVTVIETFLGVTLKISKHQYNNSDLKYDGTIAVEEHDDGTKQAHILLKNYENPADVVEQNEATFKIQKLNQ